MTWQFFERFCDEAYAIVDERDARFKKATGFRGRLDQQKIEQLLTAL
jgi:hypothetical protein